MRSEPKSEIEIFKTFEIPDNLKGTRNEDTTLKSQIFQSKLIL